MCSASAAANASKPGPRFAEDAGTRTRRAARLHQPEHRLLDRGEVRLAGHDRAGLVQRGLRVLEPVAGEHAHDPPRAVGAVAQQPGSVVPSEATIDAVERAVLG